MNYNQLSAIEKAQIATICRRNDITRPEDIEKALMNASAVVFDHEFEITKEDLFYAGLAGTKDSAKNREKVGAFLGIGYANAGTFLKRLNYMGITREYLSRACERVGIF